MINVPELSNAQVAFGECLEWMPKYDDISEDYKSYHPKDEKIKKMKDLTSAWFFRGLKKLELTPNAGVDKDKALRAIKCIIGSFAPKHEHKEAAVAYLLCEWFKDVTWES